MRKIVSSISILLFLGAVSGCTIIINGTPVQFPFISAVTETPGGPTDTPFVVTATPTSLTSPTATGIPSATPTEVTATVTTATPAITATAIATTTPLVVTSTPALTQAASPVPGVVNPNAPGLFRVIHASPGTPNLDIYLNHGAKPIISNLAFGTASPFLSYPPDTYLMTVRTAGSAPNSTPIFEHPIINSADSALNVVAVGLLTATQSRGFLLLSVPANNDPAYGRTRLQVINASPDAGPINVNANNISVAQGLLYGDGTFVGSDMTPGAYTITVSQSSPKSNSTPVVIALPNTSLNANTFYTLLTIGTLNNLHTMLLADPTKPQPTPAATPTS